jgi:hypothetical protein
MRASNRGDRSGESARVFALPYQFLLRTAAQLSAAIKSYNGEKAVERAQEGFDIVTCKTQVMEYNQEKSVGVYQAGGSIVRRRIGGARAPR